MSVENMTIFKQHLNEIHQKYIHDNGLGNGSGKPAQDISAQDTSAQEIALNEIVANK